MKVIKDEKWALKVKSALNMVIETDVGSFDAYINGGGWASVPIDDETTYNFRAGEYKTLPLTTILKNSIIK